MFRMKQRGPALRFRVFGTPVRIGLSFPIAVLVVPLAFNVPMTRHPWLFGAWALLVTVSILVHEAGHVAALRAYGFRPEVSLNAFGGLTSTAETGRLSPFRSIIVSLAGPAAGMMLGITIESALIPIAGRDIVWFRTLSWLVNIWWSLLNLLPFLPLDGGHVVRELVEVTSRRRGWAVPALLVFLVVLFGGGWWAIGHEHPIVFTIVLILTFATNVGAFAFTREQRVVQTVADAHERLVEGELREGIATLMPIVWSPDSRLVEDDAYTTLAWALLHEHRFTELCALDPGRFHRNHRALLCGATSWYRGDLVGAMNFVSGALAESPVDPPDTYFARVFGRLGEVERLAQRIAQMPLDASVRGGSRLQSGLHAAHPAGRGLTPG